MGKVERQQKIDFYKKELEGALVVILSDYSGTKVKNLEELRKKIREAGGKFLVVKNTLLKKAIAGTKFENISDDLEGPNAIAYTDSDPGGLAKALLDFAKKNDNFKVKSASMDGERVDDVSVIAKLPSFTELKAMFLNLLQAVGVKFLTLLTQGQRDFLAVLHARKAKLEENNN